MVTRVSPAVMPILTIEQIENLPSDDRSRYLIRLKEYDLDNGSDHYRTWHQHVNRCSYRDPITDHRCATQRYDKHSHCLRHLTLEDIDVGQAVRNRASHASLRMAELLDDAVTGLERIVRSTDDEVPAAVRLKAIESVLDRGQVPRHTASSVELSGDVTITHTNAADIIQGRLDRLAAGFVRDEIAGLEAAITEAELIEDADAQ